MAFLFIFIAKYLFIASLLTGAILLFSLSAPCRKSLFVFGVLSGIVSYALSRLAGALYYDPRPFVVGHFTPLVAHIADNGFPSDHVLLTSVIAAVCMIFNRTVGILLWIIVVLIAFSRVYVGVHHVVDVLGSIGISLAGTYGVYMLLRKFSTLSCGIKKREQAY